jgi:hypothetical protein
LAVSASEKLRAGAAPSTARERNQQAALVAAVMEIDCMPLGRTKQFFFEKKNQKTFVRLGGAYPAKPKPKQTKVFCFFFSKKKTFLSRSNSYFQAGRIYSK